MDAGSARWEINATLRERGFQHVGSPDQYRGPIRVGNSATEIILDIPDLTFVKLPRIDFVDRAALALPVIAHLEDGTGLCYADRSLLRLDPYQPGASILRILEQAEETIAKSLAGKVQNEVAMEFPSYWRGQNILVLFGRQRQTQRARFAVSNDGRAGSQTLLVEDKQHIPAGFRKGRAVAVVSAAGILHSAAEFTVPETLWEFEKWFLQQTTLQKAALPSLVDELAKGNAVFIAAENGWVGCQIDLPNELKILKNRNARPIFMKREVEKRKAKISLTRYYGSEASLTDITSRNLDGISASLAGKSLSLIGCGTIGSHLARFLVQSGAGNGAPLNLVDPQLLTTGNLGRHLLNFADIGKPKANALAHELSRFHPEVQTRPFDDDVSDVWHRVRSSNLIIDATGSEVVSDFINTKAVEERNQSREMRVLHVWLFGNGIAAQTFLNAGGEFACYRCLRPDLSAPWIDDPRKDVKDIGQVAAASCGDGPYLPYSVAAPVRAAAMALEATLNFFDGQVGARLRTSTIDPKRAKRLNDKSPKPHDRCPACGVQKFTH